MAALTSYETTKRWCHFGEKASQAELSVSEVTHKLSNVMAQVRVRNLRIPGQFIVNVDDVKLTRPTRDRWA